MKAGLSGLTGLSAPDNLAPPDYLAQRKAGLSGPSELQRLYFGDGYKYPQDF